MEEPARANQGSKGETGRDRRSQEEPGGGRKARGSQEGHGAARGSQEGQGQPGGARRARGSQEEQAKRSQEQPRKTRFFHANVVCPADLGFACDFAGRGRGGARRCQEEPQCFVAVCKNTKGVEQARGGHWNLGINL